MRTAQRLAEKWAREAFQDAPGSDDVRIVLNLALHAFLAAHHFYKPTTGWKLDTWKYPFHQLDQAEPFPTVSPWDVLFRRALDIARRPATPEPIPEQDYPTSWRLTVPVDLYISVEGPKTLADAHAQLARAIEQEMDDLDGFNVDGLPGTARIYFDPDPDALLANIARGDCEDFGPIDEYETPIKFEYTRLDTWIERDNAQATLIHNHSNTVLYHTDELNELVEDGFASHKRFIMDLLHDAAGLHRDLYDHWLQLNPSGELPTARKD